MPDVTEPLLQLVDQATGGNPNTWGDIADANFLKAVAAIAGATTISSTGGTVNLTDDQARSKILIVTGTLVSNLTLVCASRTKSWFVICKSTLGAYTATFGTSGQVTPITLVADSVPRAMMCDGTNVLLTGDQPSTIGKALYQTASTAAALTTLGFTALGQSLTTVVDPQDLRDLQAEGWFSMALATTMNIGASNHRRIQVISGTGPIGSFDVAATLGAEVTVLAGTGFTVTNGSPILCMGNADMVVATGDVLTFVAESTSSAIWRCTSWQRVSGKPLLDNALGAAQGFWRGLTITNGATADTQASITVDAVTATDGTTVRALTTTTTFTVNLATTGANALDTGAIAASTPYYLWVIFNPTTTTWAGLASTSSTAPTMPSGYTHKIRVGAMLTDGSSHLYRTKQVGRKAFYVVTAATNTAALRIAASGTAGATGTPTWVAVPVASAGAYFVPPTAASIKINPYLAQGSPSIMMVAPSNAYGAFGSTTNGPPVSMSYVSGQGISSNLPFEMPLESTSIYWAASGANGYLFVAGWEDAI